MEHRGIKRIIVRAKSRTSFFFRDGKIVAWEEDLFSVTCNVLLSGGMRETAPLDIRSDLPRFLSEFLPRSVALCSWLCSSLSRGSP